MKIIINFGYNGLKKEVTWYRDIMDFPKLIKFRGDRWEWAIYSNTGKDYELTFSKLATHDPLFSANMPSFEDMFESSFSASNDCACGALYTSFPQFHMVFCPKWKRWEDIK
jgi:hypothetical protein